MGATSEVRISRVSIIYKHLYIAFPRARPTPLSATLPCFSSTLLVISLDFDLDVHRIHTELLDADFRPHRLMVRHPALEVLDDTVVCGLNIRAVCNHTIYLRPALTSGMLQRVVDVVESLIYFF